MHEIALKALEPIYIKQFQIMDAHCQEVECHLLEWLKLGVVQPACSKYNSPIFAVMKKDRRALNNQSYMNKYSMKNVIECIVEIGCLGSILFSTIDLTAGLWQMILHSWARPNTAFTITGMGQFQYNGTLGLPSKLPTPHGDHS
jgi:hypothetical protein